MKTIDEQLDEILKLHTRAKWQDSHFKVIEDVKALITQSNKAYVAAVMPEKEFLSNSYDQYEVGFNNAIDTIKQNAGLSDVTQPEGLRGGDDE